MVGGAGFFGTEDILVFVNHGGVVVEQAALFSRSEGADPDLVTDCGTENGSTQKSFDFEVEAEVLEGNGEALGQWTQETLVQRGGQFIEAGGLMRLESGVAGEEFITPVTAEGDGDVLTGEPGEQVGGDDRGVAEGLIEKARHFG